MTVALNMAMEQAYKKRKHWYDCSKCNHLIAPEGEPKMCVCEPPSRIKQKLVNIKVKVD